MSSFHVFAKLVNAKFNTMAKSGEVFQAGVDKDVLWSTYLSAFPEGTNPVFRVNTEHDCSCCRNFIKNIGQAVTIKEGVVDTVWNIEGLEKDSTYHRVAQALDEHIRDCAAVKIDGVLRLSEPMYGAEKSHERLSNGDVHVWNHFWAQVPPALHKSDDSAVGEINTTIQVFSRSLSTISQEAIETVEGLISDRAIYRGEEFLRVVREFKKHLVSFKKVSADPQASALYPYENYKNPASRIRNTAIGTLLVDLSEGVDIEEAVKSFEKKVAPENYKRPTSLITPKMVEAAMGKIAELNMEASLDRRHANISDITVNNVLWMSGKRRSAAKPSLSDELMAVAKKPASVKAGHGMTVEEFLETVSPQAKTIEIMFSNQAQKNLMSITAPQDPTAPGLFKWNNGFAWSYIGEITDSIKEKVKRAGGNVDAALRFSLEWFNYDDLDIHIIDPRDNHIYFGNKKGILDVDMNAGGGRSRTPVENMSFVSPVDGVYKVMVNQYSQRERTDYGFVVEAASGSGVNQYTYSEVVKGQVRVGEFKVVGGSIVDAKLNPKLTGKGIQKEAWGVKTESWVNVDSIILSPNYWDGQAVGNKHFFFIMEGCRNDMPTRGIYNEFLSNEFTEHRKVFEILGDKTKCAVSSDQLSGLGFSSTRGDTATLRVNGEREYKITF